MTALAGLLLIASAPSPASAGGAHARAAQPHRGMPRASGSHSAARSRSGAPATKSRHARANTRKPTKAVFLERHVPAVKGGLPNIQARGAIVLDENGHEIYARNADQERPIASISKLAATLVVMDRGLDLDGLSTITKADIEVARGGARSRLLEGMTLSNRDLLHAALMGSDNRAIPTLGRAVKLSPSQLAAAMTAKAAELGLKHTRFHDPTGLSVENVSTPRETIVLLRAVMKNPVLGPVTERVQYDAHPVGRPPITYFNTYRPAIRNNVQVLGGKTGYNDDARYCLVIATKVDGHVCYMSFLSNEGKLTRFGDVARVADWMVSRKPHLPIALPPPSHQQMVAAAAPPPGPAAVPARQPAPLPGAPAPTPMTGAAPAPSSAITLAPPTASPVFPVLTPPAVPPLGSPPSVPPETAAPPPPSNVPRSSAPGD
jgi:D-alanyl-D-alanine endopeptidase (penicillin-binding protein 7)